MENSTPQYTRFIPLPEWSKHHAWPSMGALRHMVFKRKQNGFSQVIKRMGRRILIDEKAFFEWVSSQGDDIQSLKIVGISPENAK